MKSPQEVCPKCQSSQEMVLSLGLGKAVGSSNREEDVLLVHFHCKSCLTYIKTVQMSDLENVLFGGDEPAYQEDLLQLANAV